MQSKSFACSQFLVYLPLELNLGTSTSAVKQKQAEQHEPGRRPAHREQHFVTARTFFSLGNVAQQIAVHTSSQAVQIVANSIRPSFGKSASVPKALKRIASYQVAHSTTRFAQRRAALNLIRSGSFAVFDESALARITRAGSNCMRSKVF